MTWVILTVGDRVRTAGFMPQCADADGFFVTVAELERALAGLQAALGGSGLAEFSAPMSLEVIEEIEQAVAPLRPPATLRRFWELVDPASVRVHYHPDLTTPAFALQTWQAHVKEMFGVLPQVLFPIAYESHSHLFVELDGPDSTGGGAIFSYNYTGFQLRLVFADLGGYVNELATALREGRARPWGASDVWIDAESLVDRAPGIVIHPAFGPLDTIAASALEWPERWRVLNGISDQQLVAEGADHTIGEVLAAMQSGPVTARLHGTVTELAGHGDGAAVTVSDGIDRIRIWCPRDASPFAPGLNGAYEFHIAAPAKHVPAAPDYSRIAQDARLADLPVDLNQIAARLNHANRPVDAIATDVRPLTG